MRATLSSASSLPSPSLNIAVRLAHPPTGTLSGVVSSSIHASVRTLVLTLTQPYSPLQPWLPLILQMAVPTSWALCLKHTTLDQACPHLHPGCYVTCQWDRSMSCTETPGPHICQASALLLTHNIAHPKKHFLFETVSSWYAAQTGLRVTVSPCRPQTCGFLFAAIIGVSHCAYLP